MRSITIQIDEDGQVAGDRCYGSGFDAFGAWRSSDDSPPDAVLVGFDG
jgi:hypothetical protein